MKKRMNEQRVFDNYTIAKEVLSDSRAHLEKSEKVMKITRVHLMALLLGFIPGVAALMLSGLSGIFETIATIFFGLWGVVVAAGLPLAIYSYIKIGGLGKVFKWAGNAGVFLWYVVPIFPFDLMVLMVGFLFVINFMLHVPHIVVKSMYKQAELEVEAAEEYLRSFTPASDGETAA